jgi:hypothetical protein
MLSKLPPPPPGPSPTPNSDAGALLREEWERAAPEVIATAVLLARRGDMAALRMILERLMPLRRTVKLDLPALDGVGDVPIIAKKLVELVAIGTITPDEAGALTKVLDAYTNAVATTEHERRLAAIETSLAEAGRGN